MSSKTEINRVTNMLLINQPYPFITGFYEATLASIIDKYVPKDEREDLLTDLFTSAGRIATETAFKKILKD